MASVLTYSPKDVKLQIEAYTVPGIVSLTLEWRTAPFKVVDGIRGKTSRVRNTNSSAILTVEVLQSSVANDLMSQLVTEDLKSGQAKISVTLVDLSGGLSLTSGQGFVMGFADVTLSNGPDNRSWQIALLETDHKDIHGNSMSAKSIFEAGSKFLDQYL